MKNQIEMALLFDFYGDVLTDKQRDVIELYYNNDFSLSEIAADSGITRQGARDSIKRAELQLIKMEEKLGLVEKFHEMKSAFDEIQKSAHDIRELNSRFGFSKDIDFNASKIIEISEELKNI